MGAFKNLSILESENRCEGIMVAWTKGVPSAHDLPCQLVWDDYWHTCHSAVVQKNGEAYTWLAVFPGGVWYVYQTSSSSHKVINKGMARTIKAAKEAAEKASYAG